jgi:predicted nucleic acid-binding protein
MSFVVDCSTTMAWCFDDEMTAATDVILDRLRVTGAIAPVLWPLEVANVLLMAERRQRITERETARLARLLQSLPVIIDAEKATNIFGSIVALAREYRLTVYDASYLELAIRHVIPLATRDQRLRAAALAASVPLL